jgi:hypothetical protein
MVPLRPQQISQFHHGLGVSGRDLPLVGRDQFLADHAFEVRIVEQRVVYVFFQLRRCRPGIAGTGDQVLHNPGQLPSLVAVAKDVVHEPLAQRDSRIGVWIAGSGQHCIAVHPHRRDHIEGCLL